jgi:hypothetical protein
VSSITETTVANRALQHLGAKRISTVLRTDPSQNAAAIRACYDTLRRAELRRNVWRFSIRVNALRAVDLDTMLVTWPAWSNITAYAINDIVTGSDGQSYISKAASNTANDPTLTIGGTSWSLYFGTNTAQQYVAAWSSAYTYSKNQNVLGSNGSFYTSLVGSNINNNPVSSPSDWAISTTVTVGTSYYAGELVYTLTSPLVVYISLVNGNTVTPIGDTTGSWQTFTVAPTIAVYNFIYPIGAGPGSNDFTRNVFMLPNGFLREAPQAPKAGVDPFLGAPSGLANTDWEYQDDFLTSFCPGPIVFRFCADVSDPTQFDPMFVEGFAGRLGAETCEEITQSDDKLQRCETIYSKFMGEARTVNGIETGPVAWPVDEYLAVRLG